MSRKARSVIEAELEKNGGQVSEQALINALVDERGVTEDTARDYVTMYCEKTEKPDGTVQCVAFGDTATQQQTLTSEDGDTHTGQTIQTVGPRSGDKWAELGVLEDVAHPKVPTNHEEGYYRRRMMGHKSDVQIMTRALENGFNVMLKGETGVGKGELTKHVAANTNRPVYQANLGEEIRVEDLIGHYELVDGETEWVDGHLTKAVREGAIFQADEFNAASGAVTIMLHSVLEDNGVLTVPQTGETIKPHPEFRVVGTMNPQYAGTQQQNRATMNRFVHIELDYISADREVSVVMDNTSLADKRESEIESLVETVNELREDYKNGEIVTPVSTRELIQVASYIEDDWMDLDAAAKMVIGGIAEDRDQSKIEKVLETTL
jgi:nitric oxide reductase NorQ protein